MTKVKVLISLFFCCFYAQGQLGVFGPIGQFAGEKVGVFGSHLVLHSARWHAPKFETVGLYLNHNINIVAQDKHAYFETALVGAPSGEILFPLGYEGMQIPLYVASSKGERFAVGLATAYFPPTIAKRPIRAAFPFKWVVQTAGEYIVKLPEAVCKLWLASCQNCLWVGKSAEGWQPLATPIVKDGWLALEEPMPLGYYTAVSLVSLWDEKPLRIAEALTPNGDGINDFWILEKIDHYPTAHLRIYSASGLLIFESRGGYQNDWDGKVKQTGTLAPDGLYRYHIRLYGLDNRSPKLMGYLLIKAR